MKPGHMQLLLIRNAFFFLLRGIYSVRMSIIALNASGRDCTNNNELLHKIGVL